MIETIEKTPVDYLASALGWGEENGWSRYSALVCANYGMHMLENPIVRDVFCSEMRGIDADNISINDVYRAFVRAMEMQLAIMRDREDLYRDAIATIEAEGRVDRGEADEIDSWVAREIMNKYS